MSDAEKTNLSHFRDHAWDYFALHAEQRLKAFHFYVLLETGLIAAMILAVRVGNANKWIFGVIGLFIVLLSFIFWKLDQRTKIMIKVSEAALKLSEQKMCIELGDPEFSSVTPFSNDPQSLGLIGKSIFGTLTYSECFAAIFLAFAALGAGLCIFLIASN